MKNKYMFVYGTLMEGFPNHEYLSGSLKIGRGKTMDSYRMTVNGIPYVSDEYRDTQIHGELYIVPTKEVRDRVDGLEGHPDFYERKEVLVVVNKELIKAWMYICNGVMGVKKVESGDYRDVIDMDMFAAWS